MSEELRGLERLVAGIDFCVLRCPLDNKFECAYFTGNCSLKCREAQEYDRLTLYETHVPALLEERDSLEEKALQATAFCNSLAKSLAGANTKVSELLDTNARLQSELAEARERAEAAVEDLEEMLSLSICHDFDMCEFCALCTENGCAGPLVVDGPCEPKWRGPQGRGGAAIKPSDLAGARPIIDNMPGFKREAYFPQEGAGNE
jgi:hypothetical protein